MANDAPRAEAVFRFERRGRRPAAFAAIAAVWAGLGAAWIWLEAAAGILAILGAFTLPALWDILRDRRAGLEIGPDGIRWYAGAQHATASWSEVDHVALDRRLDFSVRVSLVLRGGRKIRLPQESSPPPHQLEAALTARGLRCIRSSFQGL